jgi:hypothetical protein
MNEKYVLIKPYEAGEGTLPEGSEIIYFRGQVWVNGGPVPASYNRMFLDLIKNPEYVRKVKINKNEF